MPKSKAVKAGWTVYGGDHSMNSPKAIELRQHDYFVGLRDPQVKPEFPGKFMVNDPLDGEDGYAIVGDDLDALVGEAHDHLLCAFSVS